MIAPAVKRAFASSGQSSQTASATTAAPSVAKGGLESIFHTKFDTGLYSAVKADAIPLVAAALADGCVVFVDATDGRVVARCDELLDSDPPNVMVFASSQWLVHCSDDANVRCLSTMGELVHTHAVAEPAQDGKRPRSVAVDHATVLDGGAAYVAAAGRLIHACRVPEGDLEHAVQLASPVRALCAAPQSGPSQQWSYAVAMAEGVRLISRAGESVRELTSKRIVRSLSAYGPWLAAGTFPDRQY